MTTNAATTDPIEVSTPLPSFMLGLVTGGILGTVLALAFAPRAGADLRRSVAGAAKNLGAAAVKRYEDASAGLGEAAAHLADKAQAVRNDAADAVVGGAHVPQVATHSRGEHGHGPNRAKWDGR
jgi:gas vesicle protein